MLQIWVSDRLEASTPLVTRFVALVNRLLPPGSRFSVRGGSSAQRHIGPPGSAGWDLWLYGEANLITPARSTGGQLVLRDQQGLRDQLQAVITAERTTAITLTSDNEHVMVGQFSGTLAGWIDVHDLESVPPLMAADFLTHELQEQFQAQVNGVTTYRDAHAHARTAEERVIGGRRLEQFEYVTPRGERGWWWIPYQEPVGTGVTAVLCEVRFTASPSGRRIMSDVLSGRTASFTTLAAFTSAAQRAGLELAHGPAVAAAA